MAQEDKHRIEMSYNDVAWVGSWKHRATGMWAAGTVGCVSGIIGGALAPLFPVLVGALSPAAALPLMATSIATFASAGAVTGAIAGGLVGSGSGGVADVAQEQEKRDKSRIKAMGINLPEPEKSVYEPPKGFLARAMSYINPRAGIIFITLGAAVGALFAWAAAPAVGTLATELLKSGATEAGVLATKSTMTSAILSNTGIASVVQAVAEAATAAGVNVASSIGIATSAYCMGVMGMFGATFGIRLGHLTNDLRNVYTDLLTTKFGDKEKAPEQAPQLQMQPQLALEKGAALDAPRQLADEWHALEDTQSKIAKRLASPEMISQLESGDIKVRGHSSRALKGYTEMVETAEPDCGCSHAR